MDNDVLAPPRAVQQPPETNATAPHQSAPAEERRAWCEVRVPKVMATQNPEGDVPAEALPEGHNVNQMEDHLHRVEMQACMSDPQDYERRTRNQVD
jgi:hypothetical protein